MQATTIAGFELLSPLVGGTQPIYKAKSADGQLVALKAIPLAGANEEQQQRFLRETEIAKTLDHPNLLKIIAAGSAEGHLFQVMEMLDGSDLQKVFAAKTPLSWDQRLQIMEQVCEGVGYAHARGFVHRDLKPANIFLENTGRIRVLDFGMARIEGSNLTRAGIALGTLNYMSPEQIGGQQVTASSDVFSCGVIFYEMACGRHPFSFGSGGVAEILNRVLFQTPPVLQELVTDVPPGIASFIQQALEKDPTKRPQNASELRGMLRSCRQGAPVNAAPQSPAKNDLGATRKLKRSDMEALRAKIQHAPPQASPPSPPPLPKPVAEPATPRQEVVYCPACTLANKKGSVVCGHCGASLMSTTSIKLPVTSGTRARPKWLVPALISTVVLLAALVGFLVLRR